MRKPTKEDLAKAKDAVVTGSKAVGRTVSQGAAKGRDALVSGSRVVGPKIAKGVAEGTGAVIKGSRVVGHTVASGVSSGSKLAGPQARALCDRLSKELEHAVDMMVERKRNQWCEAHDAAPTPADADAIIQTYAERNAVAFGGSGGLSLVPGPWGMAAALPAVGLVLEQQAEMICDLAAAYGKQGMISKDVVIGMLTSASQTSGIGMFTIYGGTVLIRRTSLHVMQHIITLLLGHVTQQVLKSVVLSCVPVAGAAAMAAWGFISTKRLGAKAKSILSMDIRFEGELSDGDLAAADQLDESQPAGLAEFHVLALINLMKMDRQIREEEAEFVENVLNGTSMSDEATDRVRTAMASDKCVTIQFEEFQRHPEEQLALLVDLIALAKRDGEFHPAERAYVRQVGTVIGCHADDLNALLQDG